MMMLDEWKIEDVIGQQSIETAAMIELMAYGGMIRGEVCRLRYSWLKRSGGNWAIRVQSDKRKSGPRVRLVIVDAGVMSNACRLLVVKQKAKASTNLVFDVVPKTLTNRVTRAFGNGCTTNDLAAFYRAAQSPSKDSPPPPVEVVVNGQIIAPGLDYYASSTHLRLFKDRGRPKKIEITI